MIQKPKHFVITDPREFDGNPYEVAQRAFSQAQAMAQILAATLDYAWLMARNAEMERDMALGNEPDAAGFPNTPQSKSLVDLRRVTKQVEKKIEVLGKAASYDPLHPPKES